MTEYRRRLYIAFFLVGCGSLYFIVKVLSGETPADAAVLSALYVLGIGVMLAIFVRIRRRTLQRLAGKRTGRTLSPSPTRTEG